MMRIKDRVLAGIIAGLGANLVKMTIEHATYKIGINKETGTQKSAGFFISKSKVNTPQGKILGFISDNAIAAFLGVTASYLLTVTGRDHYLLKGAALGDMSWSSLYGIMSQLGATRFKSNDPVTSLISFASHTAFGTTKTYILSKIADPGLFKPHFASLGVPERNTPSNPEDTTRTGGRDRAAIYNDAYQQQEENPSAVP